MKPVPAILLVEGTRHAIPLRRVSQASTEIREQYPSGGIPSASRSLFESSSARKPTKPTRGSSLQ
jgi:hypothetical protein